MFYFKSRKMRLIFQKRLLIVFRIVPPKKKKFPKRFRRQRVYIEETQ